MQSNQSKILLISSVLPSPTSGGAVVLHRHFNQLKDWKITVIKNLEKAKNSSLLMRIIGRLERTRFHPWLKDLEVILNGWKWEHLLRDENLYKEKSVVVTVAHGDGCWAALRFAKKHNLPLVTIFHDWWPDCPRVHVSFQKILEKQFRQLYHESTIALCVSNAMQEQLGSHPNSLILYPIPASIDNNFSKDNQIGKVSREIIRVAYSGGLYDYGPMLADLLNTVKEHPTVKLQVRGRRPNWSPEFQSEMRERGLWLDFAPRAELENWLRSMDVLLVSMSFDPALRRRMETSFSSKLLEYVQFAKPILIWGPEYCSAVVWAKEDNKALCVTDKSTDAVLSAIEQLRSSPQMQKHYAYQSRVAANGDFNPQRIQQRFVEIVTNVL